MGTFKIIWSVWERWGGECGGCVCTVVHMGSQRTTTGGPWLVPNHSISWASWPQAWRNPVFCLLSPWRYVRSTGAYCHSWLYISPVHSNLGSQNAHQEVHLRNHLPSPLWLILWGDQAWVTLTMWQHCDGSQSSVISLEHFSSNRMTNIRPKVSTEYRIKTGSV